MGAGRGSTHVPGACQNGAETRDIEVEPDGEQTDSRLGNSRSTPALNDLLSNRSLRHARPFEQ